MSANTSSDPNVTTLPEKNRNVTETRDACIECKIDNEKPTYLALHCIVYPASYEKSSAKSELSHSDFRENLIYVANNMPFREARRTMLRLLQIEADVDIDVLVQVRGWLPRAFEELHNPVNDQHATIETVLGGLESELLFHFVMLQNEKDDYAEQRPSVARCSRQASGRSSRRFKRRLVPSGTRVFSKKRRTSAGNTWSREAKGFQSITDLDVNNLPSIICATRQSVAAVLGALWRFMPQTVISRMCSNALSNREISALLKRGSPSTVTVSQSRLNAFCEWYAVFRNEPSEYLAKISTFKSCVSARKQRNSVSSSSAADCPSPSVDSENAAAMKSDSDVEFVQDANADDAEIDDKLRHATETSIAKECISHLRESDTEAEAARQLVMLAGAAVPVTEKYEDAVSMFT